jgi:hypothetical protein
MDTDIIILLVAVVVMAGLLLIVSNAASKQWPRFDAECKALCLQDENAGFVGVDYRSYGSLSTQSEAICQCYSCAERKVIEKDMGVYNPFIGLWP